MAESFLMKTNLSKRRKGYGPRWISRGYHIGVPGRKILCLW
jgi:hypothetical protein